LGGFYLLIKGWLCALGMSIIDKMAETRDQEILAEKRKRGSMIEELHKA
jgi:hypothetical protein